jgi:FkbM family methyltransferase
MPNSPRPIAFVLASTNHGTLILNRNDEHQVGAHSYGVGIEILRQGAFCPDEIDLAVRLLELRRGVYGDGVVAIDCGANIGVHTIEWARQMAGWGQVIAIEAQEYIYYALAGNIVINNCLNAKAIHAAATSADGVMRIPMPNYMERASFGSLELKQLAKPENIGQRIDYREEAMTLVRAIRLDSLNLQRLDLVKIDVEGMEIDVLEGAGQSLNNHKPILLIEHFKTDRDRMLGMLQNWGYQIYNPGGMNLLAVHASDRSRELISQDAS